MKRILFIFLLVALLGSAYFTFSKQGEVTEKENVEKSKQISDKQEVEAEEIIPVSQSDVTLFKGIAIDGTKERMVKALKKQGFKESSEDLSFLRTGFYGLESGELLSGEFNGMPVIVSVIENKGKVCGIGVVENLKRNEAQIKRAFNDLVEQFNNHKNYSPDKENQKIAESEKVGDGLRYYNKEYRAIFYQKGLDGETSVKRKVIVSLCEDVLDFRLLMYYENGFNAADGSDL